jgi:hypothetical protein
MRPLHRDGHRQAGAVGRERPRIAAHGRSSSGRASWTGLPGTHGAQPPRGGCGRPVRAGTLGRRHGSPAAAAHRAPGAPQPRACRRPHPLPRRVRRRGGDAVGGRRPGRRPRRRGGRDPALPRAPARPRLQLVGRRRARHGRDPRRRRAVQLRGARARRRGRLHVRAPRVGEGVRDGDGDRVAARRVRAARPAARGGGRAPGEPRVRARAREGGDAARRHEHLRFVAERATWRVA